MKKEQLVVPDDVGPFVVLGLLLRRSLVWCLWWFQQFCYDPQQRLRQEEPIIVVPVRGPFVIC